MEVIEAKILADVEHQLEKVIGERSNVSDSLTKKENVAANLEHDKKRLQDEIKRVIHHSSYLFPPNLSSIIILDGG